MTQDPKDEKTPPVEAVEGPEPEAPEDEALPVVDEEAEPDWRDVALRAHAEFENYKKRIQRESQEMREWGNRDLILSLLPVLDDLDRALAGALEHEISGTFVDGVAMVRKSFMAALGKAGLQRIETVNQAFDPHVHEALASLPAANLEPGMIAAEVRAGYVLGKRVLRAAQVVVAAAVEKNEEPADS